MFPQDLLIGPSVFLLSLFLLWICRPWLTDTITKRYFLPAFVVKVVGAISLGLIYHYYYSGGDTFAFHQYGSKIIWEAFIDNPIKGIKLWLSDGVHAGDVYKYSSKIWYFRDAQSFTLIRIAALFDLLTFATYTGTAILFALVSFTGSWVLFLTFYRRYPGIHLQLAFAIFFIPSVFFWASGILKDTITLASISWAIYSFDQLFFRKRIRWAFVASFVVSILLIYSIKIFILLVLVPSLIIWLALEKITSIQNKMIRVLATPILVLIGISSALTIAYQITRSDKRYSFDNISKTAKITAYDIRYWTGKDAGSGYSLGELDGSFASLARVAPGGLVVSYFRPFIWEVKNPLMLLTSLEGLLFLGLTIYMVLLKPGFLRRSKLLFSNPTLIFCITFSVTYAIAVGTTVYKIVHVNEIPAADFSYDLPCAGQPVQFYNESLVSNDNIVAWLWDFDDNGSSSNLESPGYMYSSPGIYFPKLTVSSSQGCVGSTTKMIEILPVVIPSFEVSNNCFGSLVNFSASAINNMGIQIQDTSWVINGVFFDQPVPQIPVGPPGAYEATVIFDLVNGCAVQYSESFEIIGEVVADFEIQPPCKDTPVVFSNTSAIPQSVSTTYSWLVNGVEFSNAFEPEYIFSTTGDFEIELFVYFSNCVSSVKKNITISNPPVASFETNLTKGAAPMHLEVTNNSTNATEFQWLFGTTQSSEFEPEIVLETLGIQELKLIAFNNAGCSDTSAINLEVVEPFYEILLEELIIDESDNGVGLVIKIINNGSVLLTDGEVEIQMGDVLNFKERVNEVILPYSERFIVLSPTLDLDDLSSLNFICVALFSGERETSIDNKICINLEDYPIFLNPWPNPATDFINVATILKMPADISVSIIDQQGRLLYVSEKITGQIGRNSFLIYPNLEQGIYLIRLSADNKSKEFKLVVK